MRTTKLNACVAIAALLLFTAGSAAAQEFRATIRGQVLDTSKAALPGATVSAKNDETGEIATADDEHGRQLHTFRSCGPGKYTLTVELAGFQKHTRSGMTLCSQRDGDDQRRARRRRRDRRASRFRVSRRCSRPATPTAAPSSTAPASPRFRCSRAARWRSSPLVAGVNYNAQAIYLRPFDNGALAAWSMNGGQSSNNEFLLDGAPNNANQGGNNIAYVPPAAAVQEMKISTNSYDAQYGRTAGGVVNVSLKSGTNSFHGEVYDYMRRKALAANSFILNTTSRPKTDQYIDQYGFSVDGPIFKNKTFFLFTGEKYREGTPAPLTSTVPTLAMRNGDFSGLVDASGRQIVIYDPATGRADVERQLDRAIRSRATESRRTASTRRPGRSCSTGRSPTARRPA